MITRKGEGDKWLPKPISDLESYLGQFIIPIRDYNEKECRGLRKNISYSLQHLEFIHQCSESLNLTEVIWTQNVKTFIIVSSSIIEALFFYLLRVHDKATVTFWKSCKTISGNEFKDGDKKRKIDIEMFDKVDSPIFKEMTFDALCQKVKSHKLVALSDKEFFENLSHLRKLRNRVHIRIVKDDTDTDYLKINCKDYDLSRTVLFTLLTSELFPQKKEELFHYLKVKKPLQKKLLRIDRSALAIN